MMIMCFLEAIAISDIIFQLKVSVLVLFFSKWPPCWRAAQPVLKVPYR